MCDYAGARKEAVDVYQLQGKKQFFEGLRLYFAEGGTGRFIVLSVSPTVLFSFIVITAVVFRVTSHMTQR